MADSILQKTYYPSERPPGHGEGTGLAGQPRTGPVCLALSGVPPAPPPPAHLGWAFVAAHRREQCLSPLPQLMSDPGRQETAKPTAGRVGEPHIQAPELPAGSPLAA